MTLFIYLAAIVIVSLGLSRLVPRILRAERKRWRDHQKTEQFRKLFAPSFAAFEAMSESAVKAADAFKNLGIAMGGLAKSTGRFSVTRPPMQTVFRGSKPSIVILDESPVGMHMSFAEGQEPDLAVITPMFITPDINDFAINYENDDDDADVFYRTWLDRLLRRNRWHKMGATTDEIFKHPPIETFTFNMSRSHDEFGNYIPRHAFRRPS